MALRPIWRGFIRFSLITVPVAIHAAQSDSEKIKLNFINRKTGNKIKQLTLDSITGETVENFDKAKGYLVAKDQYVEITDDDFASIKIESTHTINIESFVSILEINPLYFDSPYYISVSDPVGYETYKLLHTAMMQNEKVGIGTVVLQRRERPIALIPYDRGFIGYTLRFAYQVRDCEAYFDDLPDNMEIANEAVELATTIINQKSKEFDPSEFEDHYEIALSELIKKKIAGIEIKEEEVVKPQPAFKAQAIMDILRAAAQQENIKIPAVKIPTTPKRKRKAAA